MTYDEWIAAVFDHRVTDPAWYFKSDDEASAELWHLPEHPEAAVQLITRTFQESGKLPDRFSDGQIAAGLNFIINTACSNLPQTIFDINNNVNPLIRWKCIEAIYTVYKELFAKRCSPHLGHNQFRQDPSINPLNSVCYMWWEVAPVYARREQPRYAELDQAVLRVMGQTLTINSEPCREGALHGLGHWSYKYPEAVTALINDHLDKHVRLSPSLKSYARNAKRGMIQ